MAIIQFLESKQFLALGTNHMIGRRRDKVDTVFPDSSVSGIHASIQWTGNNWELVSIGRNGTWLNDTPVDAGQRQKIQTGDQVFFAAQGTNGIVVKECSPPSAALIKVGGGFEASPLSSYQSYAESGDESAAIFKSNDGSWYLEKSDQKSRLNNGDRIKIGRNVYQFLSPSIHQLTEVKSLSTSGFPTVMLNFLVSLNQEHIRLKLTLNKREIDLGERSHHHLLFILADEYLSDSRNGLPVPDRGWVSVEDLAKQLKTESTHINIMIHRARKQFIAAFDGQNFPVDWIERRSGEVRIGINKIRIMNGDKVTTNGL